MLKADYFVFVARSAVASRPLPATPQITDVSTSLDPDRVKFLDRHKPLGQVRQTGEATAAYLWSIPGFFVLKARGLFRVGLDTENPGTLRRICWNIVAPIVGVWCKPTADDRIFQFRALIG